MLRSIDLFGIVGGLLALGGLGVLVWADPRVAAGIALVLVGVALVVRSLVVRTLQSLGMGGLV